MKNSLAFYQNILNTLTENIVVMKTNGDIIYVNQSWSNFAKLNQSETDNWEKVNYLKVCENSIKLGDDYAKKAFGGITDVVKNKKEHFFLEYPCHGKNEKRWFMMNVTALEIEDEKYIAITHQNITDRVLSEQKVKKLSMIDFLTELPNRRYFDEFLLKEFNRNKRNKKPITLAMIDIDNFKSFNDTYGHQIGDIVLKEIAKVFKKHIKRSSDLSARYGGEEFAIIFGEIIDKEVYSILEDIQNDIRNIKIKEIEDKNVSISITIGLATVYPDKSIDQFTLIKKADEALYIGKNEGKDRIVISDL